MACDADLLQFISGNARMTADYKSGFAFSGSYELRNNFSADGIGLDNAAFILTRQ